MLRIFSGKIVKQHKFEYIFQFLVVISVFPVKTHQIPAKNLPKPPPNLPKTWSKTMAKNLAKKNKIVVVSKSRVVLIVVKKVVLVLTRSSLASIWVWTLLLQASRTALNSPNPPKAWGETIFWRSTCWNPTENENDYAHMLIVVAFFSRYFLGFSVITRHHDLFEGCHLVGILPTDLPELSKPKCPRSNRGKKRNFRG